MASNQGQQPSKYPHLQQDLTNFKHQTSLPSNPYTNGQAQGQIQASSNSRGPNDKPVFQSMLEPAGGSYMWDSMVQPSMSRNISSSGTNGNTPQTTQSARVIAAPSPSQQSFPTTIQQHGYQTLTTYQQAVGTGYAVQGTAQGGARSYLSNQVQQPVAPQQVAGQNSQGMQQFFTAMNTVNQTSNPAQAYNYPPHPSVQVSQNGLMPTQIPLSINGPPPGPAPTPNTLQPPEVNIFHSLGAPVFNGNQQPWAQMPPGPANNYPGQFGQPQAPPAGPYGYNQQPQYQSNSQYQPQPPMGPPAYNGNYSSQPQPQMGQGPAGADMLALTIFAEAVFNRHDVQKQGFVGSDQFQRMVGDLYQTVGRPTPTPQAIRMFQYSFDQDGNGVIDKNEWMGLATRLLSQPHA